MQKPYQNYKPVDFLKDERFIKWQLFPDEEDHLYWNSFIKKQSFSCNRLVDKT